MFEIWLVGSVITMIILCAFVGYSLSRELIDIEDIEAFRMVQISALWFVAIPVILLIVLFRTFFDNEEK